MNLDEFIDGLSAEAAEAMRGLLRQAYERGYREALGSAGQPAAPVPIEQPPRPAPAPDAAPVAWAGAAVDDADDTPGDDGDEGEDDDNGEEAPPPRPILANAKVGTLRRRIIRTFELERFAIDVVICKKGDANRRQLKSSAPLASYRREEA